MTLTEPNIADNARVPIGEAAKILGINRETLRKYTTENDIRCGYRKANKRKFYTGAAIKQFWRAQS